MNYFPTVAQAVAGDDFIVYAYFTDGTVRLLDVKPLLNQGGVFTALREPECFRGTLTVMNDTVAWDLAGNRDPSGCIDIDPCMIYERCPVVEDPLRDISA